MTIKSPGRFVTFFSILIIAVLIMSAPEWHFILNSKSTIGIVTSTTMSNSNTISFNAENHNYNFRTNPRYSFPELEKGEQVSVRYLLNDEDLLLRAYIYWFWAIFSGKFIILIVACLPWYAFVWSMPAIWRFRIGNEPKGNPSDISEEPIDDDRLIN